MNNGQIKLGIETPVRNQTEYQEIKTISKRIENTKKAIKRNNKAIQRMKEQNQKLEIQLNELIKEITTHGVQ